MTRKADAERLKQALADQVIEAMLPYVKPWIQTLGEAGKPRNKAVSAAVRVSAAKTGIELMTKFMSSGTNPQGEDLLKKLEAIGSQAPAPPDEDDGDEDEEVDDPADTD